MSATQFTASRGFGCVAKPFYVFELIKRIGEVLVTDSVMDSITQKDHLRFENIGQVKLKGFDQPRRLFRATLKE